MPLVKAVSVDIKVTGTEDAKLKIDQVAVKAEELKKLNPEITPKIDSAKALLEARLLRAGLKAELERGLTARPGFDPANPWSSLAGLAGGGDRGGPGFLTKLLKGADGSGGVLGSLGGLPWPAIGGAAAAVAALLPEVVGVASGLAAAAVGAGAFAAVALPTFEKLKGDIAAVHNANQTFQESALNVDTALRHSSLDAAAYNKALSAMPPNLASAAKLLGDQNVRWQDLSQSQQNSVIALANNKAALTSLLPSQRTALSALLQAKTAWDDMNPAQQKAATSLNQLANTYQKIVTALQPDVFRVLNAGLKIANTLLPALQPLAAAGANSIDGLLTKLAGFVQSGGFKDWLAQFTKLIGPSIGAVGVGIGKVAIALGHLLTEMSQKDVVHAINIAFDVLSGTLSAVRGLLVGIMKTWDFVQRSLIGQFGILVTAAAKAFGWVPGLGPQLKAAERQFDAWAGNLVGGLQSVQAQAGITSASLAAVANAALGAFSLPKRGPGSLTGIGSATPHAAGGWASGWTLAGERGPELLYTPGSQVYTAQQTRGMLGGNSYHITVNVPPGSQREAGREIVNAIRAFEKGSGAGWRK